MNPPNIYSLTFVLPKNDGKALMLLADLTAAFDGVSVLGASILSKDKAIDLTLQDHSLAAIRRQLDTLISQRNIPIDYCLQLNSGRRKRLLICDMDSTLIGQECIDELAGFAGVKDRVAEITERTMQGELDFEAALKERVALLKGLSLTALDDCYEKRITLNPGARTLARTMAAHGAETVIVSGGFTFFSSRIAKAAGFNHHQANTLEDDGKALSGTVAMPILGRDAKREALKQYAEAKGGTQYAIAIGDGANDLAMIQAAGLGIAYKAKPIVSAAAHTAINYTDLTSALYFQGYKDSEILRS